MNDRQFRKQKKRVLFLEKKWRDIVTFGGWTCSFAWYRGEIPDYAEAIGTANVDWEYLRVQFSFNLEDVARQSDQQLEYVYLHEVAHHLVNEMREDDPTGKHEERVVSTIAKVILRARYAK